MLPLSSHSICSFSVVVILLALAGPQWLQTEEYIPVACLNASYRSSFNETFVIKSTNASLWILCTKQGNHI